MDVVADVAAAVRLVCVNRTFAAQSCIPLGRGYTSQTAAMLSRILFSFCLFFPPPTLPKRVWDWLSKGGKSSIRVWSSKPAGKGFLAVRFWSSRLMLKERLSEDVSQFIPKV